MDWKWIQSILGHFEEKCKCHHMTEWPLLHRFRGHFMVTPVRGGAYLVGKWLWMRHSMWSQPLFSRDFELEKIRELPCIFLSSHFSRDLKALSTLKLLSKILYIQLYILFSVQHTNPNRPGWICISHKIWKICSIIYEESYCMIHTDIDSNTFSILWRYYQSLIS